MAEQQGEALRIQSQLRWIWSLAGMLGALVLTLAVPLLSRLLSDADDDLSVPWLWALAALPLLLGLAWGWGLLRFRSYGAWLHAGAGVCVRRGIWWRHEVWVPIARLQHLELRQEPLARAFGLASLHLHTAGQHDRHCAIPGLSLADAQQLRARLMPLVRGEHE